MYLQYKLRKHKQRRKKGNTLPVSGAVPQYWDILKSPGLSLVRKTQSTIVLISFRLPKIKLLNIDYEMI